MQNTDEVEIYGKVQVCDFPVVIATMTVESDRGGIHLGTVQVPLLGGHQMIVDEPPIGRELDVRLPVEKKARGASWDCLWTA